MKLCIFGAVSLIDRIDALAEELRAAGHEVMTPTQDEDPRTWETASLEEKAAKKRSFIDADIADLKAADAVLIANFPRHGVGGYVGAHTLMEAAFAYALGKEVIFLLEPLPQPSRLEALAVMSRCVGGDVSKI